MRILNAILTLDPAYGGPVEGLRRSVESQVSMRDHQREIVCLDAPSAPWLATWPCPVHALGPGVTRYRYSAALTRWLPDNAGRFDAVIVNGVWNYSSVAVWRSLAGGPVPYFVFTHGMLDPWFRQAYPVKHWLKQGYWWLLQGRTLEGARGVMFTTQEEQHLALSAYRGFGDYRHRVVSYGTADVASNATEQLAAFHAVMPQLKGRRFLLFLSRLHAKKGCDLLIEAFGAIAGRFPDLDLVMAGPDQSGWKAKLQQRAAELGVADRIHWPGMISADVKFGAFRAAEAFVLPSHSENFGIVVAEALACGTPVLITDKVNIWREVERSGAGLVSSDDRAGVEAMLLRFLTASEDERLAMKAAARPCFLANFEIEAASRSLFQTLEEMTA